MVSLVDLLPCHLSCGLFRHLEAFQEELIDGAMGCNGSHELLYAGLKWITIKELQTLSPVCSSCLLNGRFHPNSN